MNDKPETWASWDDVCAAVAKGNLDGIGLQLLEIAGFVALDLDDVRDGHGEPLLPWADELIHRAASYAEWTPSGTGARIIGRIDPKFVSTHTKRSHPEGGEFEVYANLDTGRYITVTGDRIEGVPDALSDITTLVIELMGAGNVSAADVETLAGYAPCSLFALTVARSGERKSSCDKLLIAPAHDFQKELIEKYREASDGQRI